MSPPTRADLVDLNRTTKTIRHGKKRRWEGIFPAPRLEIIA
ncbi:hypothetical protein ACWJIK_11575 [Corynebacterium minutissimum]